MQQPQGFVDTQHLDFVCPIYKSLNGLKRTPRAWFEKFTTHLLSLGFQASSANASLFVWHYEHNFIILLLYVDDIIIMKNNLSMVQTLIKRLATCYNIFWALRFLAQKIISLSQTKYVVDLLCKFKMDGAKQYSSPVISGSRLSLLDGDPLLDPSEYRSAVGAL